MTVVLFIYGGVVCGCGYDVVIGGAGFSDDREIRLPGTVCVAVRVFVTRVVTSGGVDVPYVPDVSGGEGGG